VRNATYSAILGNDASFHPLPCTPLAVRLRGLVRPDP
jgi:hypothetical protein